MSGGPVSVSGPHPPIGTTPRLAPKARTGRQADPRRSPHQGPGGASLPAPSIRKRAEPGVSAKPPQKTAGRGQTASGHGPLPRHSIRSGQKTGGSGKGRKQRRRRDGGEGGEGEKGEGSQKAGKQKSWEAGSRKAGKPESGEAGKRGSREAGGGIKKRRRTVGCTSACGSQQSLAYRNYLLR